MFNKNSAQSSKAPDPQKIDTLIGVHSVFKGELVFEGAVRIDGTFEGNITSEKGGLLIVSEEAKVTGDVKVPNLILHGTIQGNVHSSNSIKLGDTGCLNGDLAYNILSLAEGSSINGRCGRINPPVSKPQPAKKETA
ncbi:MAG: hypothetical protein CO186_02455 [Zetaproteobacteria bacterium CG_4_9_14_3_um_filter_49_83]|nr:MAG: hypothetical protein AUJ56_06500 [Zetaproteobacteria bacterium CG1_02_49_23]PIQ33467.1 MAG: hypothetical protein COW62_05220 [Zetaproteobacteria bacterium CG17_big_fil_post_rev_8_21_14_2_50_50_13]PIV30327.1 MAG: hypothetical protein COS35_07355 [Zetaproteobacteria bacterium CG02_land_8_20_14_3_00_50_9]PIY55674.1 MAG: hypothetical protein COZ00_08285 [Zetaproteobacteria bacterium CG_4_10_14_0_8_um_filter_49_80]PJA36025.1 MAG: hypothetical protein CO186_02455 [Zetaproteobacteria bacterium